MIEKSSQKVGVTHEGFDFLWVRGSFVSDYALKYRKKQEVIANPVDLTYEKSLFTNFVGR